MQLIENKIKIKDYLDIDIFDSSFDDIENATVEVDATFQVELANNGISIEVYQIKSVKWSYFGIKFTENENEEHEVTGSSDETWTININKESANDANIGLYLTNIAIDLQTMVIDITFEY